jgi:hypothetical protein
VLNDDLELLSGRVPGDDPWSRLADPVVRSGRPFAPALLRIGVRYVLIQHIGSWRSFLPRIRGLTQVYAGDTLSLYRGTAQRVPSFRTPPIPPVLAADIAAGALALWALAVWLLAQRSRRLLSFRQLRKTEGTWEEVTT